MTNFVIRSVKSAGKMNVLLNNDDDLSVDELEKWESDTIRGFVCPYPVFAYSILMICCIHPPKFLVVQSGIMSSNDLTYLSLVTC